MSRERVRYLMFASGAVVSAGLAVAVGLIARSTDRHAVASPRSPIAGCQRSPVIRSDYFCGGRVLHRNPDGRYVVIGRSSDVVAPATHPWGNQP